MMGLARGILLSGLLSGLVAAAASAQQRPTLSETDSRVGQLELLVQDLLAEKERMRESVCGAADVAGESYRPYVCDPRCDCLDETVGGFTSCSETVSGEYTLDFEVDRGPCQPVSTCVVPFEPGGLLCATSSPSTCPYTGSEVCFQGVCLLFCTTDADCPPANRCAVEPQTGCTVDADCDPGETCDFLVSNTCTRLCTSDSECVIPRTGSLVGVDGADSTAPVACTSDLPNPLTINANDALECLAQVGAGLGVSCASICGNGVVGPGETCDDGNATPGYGCDSSCQLET